MLHAISWKEYFTLVGLGLLVYYGWWLVRFYPTLRFGGVGKAAQGRQVLPEAPVVVKGGEGAKTGEAGKTVAAAAGGVIGEPDQAGAAVSSPSNRLPTVAAAESEKLPVPAVITKPLLLPVLAGDLRNEVQALVLRASETNMVEGELVFAFHQLLTKEPYNRLRGTHFEKKISEQIVSDLERHGPVRVDVVAVSGWWT